MQNKYIESSKSSPCYFALFLCITFINQIDRLKSKDMSHNFLVNLRLTSVSS